MLNQNNKSQNAISALLKKLRRYIFPTLFLSLAIMCACVAQQQKISIKKSDGTILKIPIEGRLANEDGVKLSREIQKIDIAIKNWKKSFSANEREALPVMYIMMIEARNEAVNKLELAYQTAQKTSGILDFFLLRASRSSINDVKTILKTPPPQNPYVVTHISALTPDAIIHYMGVGQFDSGNKDWKSYNEDQKMKIGRYVFRVKIPDKPVYKEIVLIIEDPTSRTLVPVEN